MKKSQTPKPRLALRQETVRALADQAMETVVGGLGPRPLSGGQRTCAPTSGESNHGC